MKGYNIGMMAKSLAGHDKDKIYMIYGSDDQYAYLVVYDEHENSSFSVAAKDNGIYRIDLSDGSYRVVESDANDDTKIHVVSDDDIYIIQSEMNFLFQAHRQVYFFDCGTGSKEKLIII